MLKWKSILYRLIIAQRCKKRNLLPTTQDGKRKCFSLANKKNTLDDEKGRLMELQRLIGIENARVEPIQMQLTIEKLVTEVEVGNRLTYTSFLTQGSVQVTIPEASSWSYNRTNPISSFRVQNNE